MIAADERGDNPLCSRYKQADVLLHPTARNALIKIAVSAYIAVKACWKVQISRTPAGIHPERRTRPLAGAHIRWSLWPGGKRVLAGSERQLIQPDCQIGTLPAVSKTLCWSEEGCRFAKCQSSASRWLGLHGCCNAVFRIALLPGIAAPWGVS